MTPARFRWGILFVTVGVLLLINNAGLLSWHYWPNMIIKWWPVLLIAIGIEKIFIRTRLQFISYLAPLLLVGGMAYYAVITGSGYYQGGFFSEHTWSEPDDETTRLTRAVVRHDEYDLYVSHTRFDLVRARFDRFTEKPEIEFNRDGETVSLEIDEDGDGFGAITFHGGRNREEWRLYFSEEVPLRLKCTGDGSDVNLNLAAVPLEELAVDNDRGDIYLKAGKGSPLVRIAVRGERAEFTLDVPSESGIKVTGDEYDEYFRKLGFLEEGGNLKSAGFDTCDVRFLLELGDDLKHLAVDYY